MAGWIIRSTKGPPQSVGLAHHTQCLRSLSLPGCKASCVRVGAGASDKNVAEVPEWVLQLRPELAAVMRSLQRLSGAALARPDMKPFRQLIGSFSPDALLALGDACSQRALLLT